MRDLDQLQEQDPDERGRSLGTWLALATVLLVLLAAAFVWWQRGEKAGTGPEDPLDQLAALGRTDAKRAPDAGKSGERRTPPPKLNYERALTEEEDRPEVVAALAAAAHEEERLAKAQKERAAQARGGVALPEPEPVAQSDAEDDELEPLPATTPIPAGLAASAAASKLEKSAKHDKLVAAAMPKSTKGYPQTAGSGEGEFMLQVISYGARAQAEAFASSLRSRGHEVSVEASEVKGRARTYRVRIGPFKSKPAADAYRRVFDEREHMNTIVVRRDE